MQVTDLGQHDDEKGLTCNAAIPRLCALGPAPLPHAHGRGQHPAFPVVRLQNVFHTACSNARSACHSPYSLSLMHAARESSRHEGHARLAEQRWRPIHTFLS